MKSYMEYFFTTDSDQAIRDNLALAKPKGFGVCHTSADLSGIDGFFAKEADANKERDALQALADNAAEGAPDEYEVASYEVFNALPPSA